MIVYWKIIKGKDKDTGEAKKFFMLKYSKVFNLDQVESVYEAKHYGNVVFTRTKGKPHPLDKYRINTAVRDKFEHGDGFEPAEQVIADSGAKINYGGSRACYSPSTDEIDMPEKDRFEKLSEFYNTIFHELTHWAEKRTGFKKAENETGRRGYALGELVAEMGSCFVAEQLGVPMQSPDDDQSAAYLKSWLGALKDDPKFIFVASKWASKAADVLLDDVVEYDTELRDGVYEYESADSDPIWDTIAERRDEEDQASHETASGM